MKWYITIHKPKMKALGATFWPIMAIRKLEDKRTRIHEETHMKDQLMLLLLPFSILYGIFHLLYSYDYNPFEQHADAVADGAKYKPFGWITYL